MECLYINDLYELAEYMSYRVEDKSEVVAVLFFEDAQKLMRILMADYETDIGVIDITNAEYDGYEGEYYVCLTCDGMLSVEQAWCEDMYLTTCADLLLIDGDASYDIVNRNIDSECMELCFAYREDENNDHCDCEHCNCCNDDVEGEIDISIDIDDKLESFFGLLNYLF